MSFVVMLYWRFNVWLATAFQIPFLSNLSHSRLYWLREMNSDMSGKEGARMEDCKWHTGKQDLVLRWMPFSVVENSGVLIKGL